MLRLGEPIVEGQTYGDRPGAYGVILRDDKVLLTLEHTASGNDIALPGGGIDEGEPPIQALHREVLEETGWRIAPSRKLGAYQRFCYMPEYNKWARKVCHIYLARAITRLSDPLEPQHDAFWAPMDIATDLISNPADGRFLERFGF